MRLSSTRTLALIAFATIPALIAAACGSSGYDASATTGATGGHAPTTSSSTSSGFAGGMGTGGHQDHGTLDAISVDPPMATITIQNGTPIAQQFQATAHYHDGWTQMIAATWSATNLAVGKIDGSGKFSASGAQGGVVKVSATDGTHTASADLTVKMYVLQNPGAIDPNTIKTLQQAASPDGSIVWSYPYDGTVFPRGLGAPPLMWNGGAAADTYYVHLTSGTFELEAFANNLPSRFDLDPTTWDQFANSTSGDAELKVARLSNGAATVVVDHHWTIAPASMRGTIYYWAINTGRVMRIKPGAAAPDDFLGPQVTCPSCHTVSANGAKLVMNEGSWPVETSISYDLGMNTNAFSGYPSNGGGAAEFALAGVSADGKVVVENFAPLRGPIAKQTGAFDALTGAPIPATGLEGLKLWMPAFSPDDKLLVYTEAGSHDLRAFDWDEATQKAANDRLIVPAGGDASKSYVSFPTASPDHAWVIYQRSNTMGSLGNASNLYAADSAQGTEVALDALNGAAYPFAAGDRDRNWNYEPTFAPVAAGGYFWVVFHSRRTFGNALTGAAYNGEAQGTKQLWVAAIDINPQPGKDPSHPAFHLPGQALDTLNMRGYWALDPCKGDGIGCAQGTECCGGYCDDPGDGGAPTCKSTSNGCSHSGDHCATDADCCDNATGTTCINNVCSEPPPK
jgi:hypothetical protein